MFSASDREWQMGADITNRGKQGLKAARDRFAIPKQEDRYCAMKLGGRPVIKISPRRGMASFSSKVC